MHQRPQDHLDRHVEDLPAHLHAHGAQRGGVAGEERRGAETVGHARAVPQHQLLVLQQIEMEKPERPVLRECLHAGLEGAQRGVDAHRAEQEARVHRRQVALLQTAAVDQRGEQLLRHEVVAELGEVNARLHRHLHAGVVVAGDQRAREAEDRRRVAHALVHAQQTLQHALLRVHQPELGEQGLRLAEAPRIHVDAHDLEADRAALRVLREQALQCFPRLRHSSRLLQAQRVLHASLLARRVLLRAAVRQRQLLRCRAAREPGLRVLVGDGSVRRARRALRETLPVRRLHGARLRRRCRQPAVQQGGRVAESHGYFRSESALRRRLEEAGWVTVLLVGGVVGGVEDVCGVGRGIEDVSGVGRGIVGGIEEMR